VVSSFYDVSSHLVSRYEVFLSQLGPYCEEFTVFFAVVVTAYFYEVSGLVEHLEYFRLGGFCRRLCSYWFGW